MAGFLSKAEDLARFSLDGHSKVALQAVSERLLGTTISRSSSRPFKSFPSPQREAADRHPAASTRRRPCISPLRGTRIASIDLLSCG